MSNPDSEPATPGFRVFTTLRYEPEFLSVASIPSAYPAPVKSPYYLLSYHYERLLESAREFEWDDAIEKVEEVVGGSMEKFAAIIDKRLPGKISSWRLRVLINYQGEIFIEALPTSPYLTHQFFLPPDNSFTTLANGSETITRWTLWLDTQPTEPSIFTKHKTTIRDLYDAARVRAGLKSMQEPREVLLFNENGELFDGSLATLYVKSREPGKNEWITPALSCGASLSTTRRYALNSGYCKEGVVYAYELYDGEEAWLSNAAKGFMPGVVRLREG
ncbi:hypothetical protein FQN57_001558 [Myotisia sp. PD_48]|nr:hypothetical protein FQN57_001558 [Myotisia sp. PD_48]